MQKHVLWAALVLSAVLPLSGCEVDNCEQGTVGCVGGAPDPKTGCKFGLVDKGGTCVEPGSGGGNGSTDDAGKPDANMSACAECDDPALCVPDRKECVNFCETPTTFPNTGPFWADPNNPLLCGGERDSLGNPLPAAVDLKFEQICTNTCLFICRYWNWFCEGAAYDCTTECKKPEKLMDCMKTAADMPKGCGDPDLVKQRACQQAKCEEVRSLGCEEKAGLCPINPDKPGDTGTPKCGNVVCSNTCAKRNLFDSYCDDGAFSNGATDFCAWGSDCSDCGPRMGDPGPLDTGKIKIGDVCPNSFRCEGNTLKQGSSVVPNEAWCRQLGADGNTRCIQDCSTEGETCPAGFECQKLNPPYADDEDRVGKGCYPTNDCQ